MQNMAPFMNEQAQHQAVDIHNVCNPPDDFIPR